VGEVDFGASPQQRRPIPPVPSRGQKDGDVRGPREQGAFPDTNDEQAPPSDLLPGAKLQGLDSGYRVAAEGSSTTSNDTAATTGTAGWGRCLGMASAVASVLNTWQRPRRPCRRALSTRGHRPER
jgi:hypothetical protein